MASESWITCSCDSEVAFKKLSLSLDHKGVFPSFIHLISVEFIQQALYNAHWRERLLDLATIAFSGSTSIIIIKEFIRLSITECSATPKVSSRSRQYAAIKFKLNGFHLAGFPMFSLWSIYTTYKLSASG